MLLVLFFNKIILVECCFGVVHNVVYTATSRANIMVVLQLQYLLRLWHGDSHLQQPHISMPLQWMFLLDFYLSWGLWQPITLNLNLSITRSKQTYHCLFPSIIACFALQLPKALCLFFECIPTCYYLVAFAKSSAITRVVD